MDASSWREKVWKEREIIMGSYKFFAWLHTSLGIVMSCHGNYIWFQISIFSLQLF